MKAAIGVLTVMAGLMAADLQAGGPYGNYNYGPNGFYYSGTYGQFNPPIYMGPRTAAGSYVTTSPGRSQYVYNNNYGNGAVLQQYGQSTYLPNGGYYPYYGGPGYSGAGYGGYPGYGGYGGGYGSGYGGYGSGFGYRSGTSYGRGW